MDSFSTLIDRLGGRSVVAAAIGSNAEAVRKMSERNNIRPEYWPALIGLAREKRISGVSFASLTKIAPPRKKKARAA